jgi:hypothetical protein
VDGVRNVYPAPTAQPPTRIRSLASGSTWAVAGDAIYSWNGTSGKIYNLDVGTDLLAIAPITDSDVWAVGYSSLVAHWNGGTWTVDTLPLGSALSGVSALSANDVWAVGNFGVVGHFTGTWSAVSLPGSPALEDVWAVGPNDVWASEWNGGLWHYDGTWSKVTSAGTGGFGAVWSPAAGDVWALGDEALYRGNATAVATYTVPGASTTFGLEAVWGSSASDVWVADSTSMFHFANGAWSTTPGGARWLTGRNANDVLAVGATHVRRFDGNAWSDVFQVGFSPLNGMWRSPNGDIWFAGANRTILRERNGELRRMKAAVSGVGDVVLRSVWGSSDADIWFGGTGTSFLHVVNGELCAVPNGGVQASVISGSAADDVWAIGDGKSVHWDGKAWSASTLTNATSIFAFSKTDAWATGGATVQRWNGSAWSPVTMPVTIDSFFTRFGIISGTASNDVWIPVDQFSEDEVLHWDGGTWKKWDSPGVNFKAAHARAANDVWLLDWDVHHFDGVEWKQLTKFPRRNVSAAIATDTDLWIATTDGGILRLAR